MAARDQFDVLAPEFRVQVNGAALPADAQADLIGVSLLEDLEAASMFTVTLAAWDTVQMKPKWIDDALFREGNPVDIGLGYADDTPPLMSGEITAVEPEFGESRPPTLTLRGHDLRHRLMRARRSRSFTNCKDSDIASRLAGEAGLKPEVDDTGVTLPHVLQHNQTDLEFLTLRARRIGYELAVQGRTLMFRQRKNADSEIATLHREIELLEFRPRLSTFGQVPQLKVHGWDPSAKQPFVGQAGTGDESKLMGGTSGLAAVQRAFEPPATARVDAPVHSQAEADQLAARGVVEMAMGFIRAEGVCIGDPTLRAGKVVRIEGLGERFSGAYYLTSVEHRFGRRGGFRTLFSARRNAST